MNSLKPLQNSVFLLAIFLTHLAWGAEAEPLVAPLPDFAQWNIVITPKGKPEPEKTVLNSVQGQRNTSVRKESLVWSTGETVRYTNSQATMETILGRDQPIVRPLPRFGNANALGQFAELSWIRKENATTQETVADRPCQVYESVVTVTESSDPGDSPQSSASNSVTYHRKAWIDMESRFPVAFENDQWRYEYEIEPLTSSPNIAIPPKFETALKTYFQPTSSQ